MGVKTLWPVVECTGQPVDLRQLAGQTWAVDLAGWAVQNSQCRALGQGRVAKPHVRNIFFRTATLLSLGIRPVFVLDGHAPQLKSATLANRRRAETGESAADAAPSLCRRRLKGVMNECQALLAALGIQCMQAKGEGEALGAGLSRANMVNGMISDDSDAFCYGARTVLRHFSITTKGVTGVELYEADRIETDLGLAHNHMIFMAIFLGCDLCPSGVVGVGKESVLQMFRLWPRGLDAVRVLQFWIRCEFRPWKGCSICVTASNKRHCDDCRQWRAELGQSVDCPCERLSGSTSLKKLETSLKQKCLALGMDWWVEVMPQILKEFASASEDLPQDVAKFTSQQCPNISQCLNIMSQKLLWVEEYSLEKLIPILTRWQVNHLASGGRQEVVEPESILKARVVGGVACVLVQWRLIDTLSEAMRGLPESFESLDQTQLISDAYPELFQAYVQAQTKPKKTKKAPRNCHRPQKAITEFFTQTKDPGLLRKVLEPKATQNLDATEVFDCSDLSFIIEDIISQGQASKRPPSSPEKTMLTHGPPVTSTPTSFRPQTKNIKMVNCEVKSAFGDQLEGLKKEEDVGPSDPFNVEDSFDRMCM